MKVVLDDKELESWKRGDMIPESVKNFTKGKWRIVYIKGASPALKVIGYNGVTFGDIVLDHGCCTEGGYYPILRFRNSLSFVGFSHICSDTLTTQWTPYAGDEITKQSIIDIVEESWNKIKNFLNEEEY